MGRRVPDRPEHRVGAELMAGLQFDGARQFVEEDVSLVARLRPAQARKGQLGPPCSYRSIKWLCSYLEPAPAHYPMKERIMLKLAWILTFAGLMSAPVLAQTPAQGSIPDLRGTWKGESESVVFGAGAHPHHGSGPQEGATRFTSQPFTMTIDKQDGRRFSGTFSSERH